MQVERGGLDRRAHHPGVGNPVRPEAGAQVPAVVLKRGMGDGRHAHRVPVALLGLRIRPAWPRPGREQMPDPAGVVGQQPPLRQHGQLEAERIAHGPRMGKGRRQHRGPQPQRVRHGDDREPPDDLRVVGRHGPGDQAAPVVPDDDGIGLAERAHQPGRVGCGCDQVIAARRLVACAVAAQVRSDNPVAGLAQRCQLAAPRPPELREPVQQQHQRPVAAFGDVKPRAVGTHRAVRPGPADVDGAVAARSHG